MNTFEVDYNIYKTDGTNDFALVFNDNELKIDYGFSVGSKYAFGVYSHNDGIHVINNGTIQSDASFALVFTGINSFAENYGKITGAKFGVALAGDGDGVSNGGDIYGSTEAVYVGPVANGKDLSTVPGVSNGGTIRSDHDAIRIHMKAGQATYIENDEGVIHGAENAVHTEVGSIDLWNYALIEGRILCAAPGERDAVHNEAQIAGPVRLGGGSDWYEGTYGNSTSGAVFGEGGNDLLAGGSHGDKLHGGLGKDTLIGGGGHDQFFFDTALNGSFDGITDFTPGADKIMLSHAIFHGVNTPGHVLSVAIFHAGPGFTAAGQRVDYDPGTGWLTYDSNGSAAGGVHNHFATLAPHLTLHSTDFMVVV